MAELQQGTPQGARPGSPGLDTFPKLLIHHARLRPERPAVREKDFGIWQSWSWAEALAQVRAIACGLAAAGLKRGDKLAVVGDNRPHLYWSMVAAQALGAVPVPIYQDANAGEMQFVLEHAEVRFAVAEDQEQVDKLLEAMERLKGLERIIYDDPRGLRNYKQPALMSLASLEEAGGTFDAAHPAFFMDEIGKGKGSDVASFYYTSGTTGQPKGVMLSFDNLILTAESAAELEGLNDRDLALAYLPMAWVGDNVFSVAQAYCTGFCIACPESGATVMQDLREIGPTYFFAPPRIWENILTGVMIRIEDAGALKRAMFKTFMDHARRVGTRILIGEPVALMDRLLYWFGGLLVYGPLKNTLGMSRIRLAYTAGEAIGPDIFTFYRSLGVNIKQLYGSTEASVFVTIQPNGEIWPETVGRPVAGVELKITEGGEVMFKSPGVFVEYYKNPEATAAAKTPDGWMHTGDAGYIDEHGHLKIIDRAADVGRLSNGTLFAPKYLENKLKFFPYIKEAVAFGHGRDHAAAFISIDMGAVGNWAERRGLAYSSYSELADKPEVYELIKGNVEAVNRDLARDPVLAGSQIKRYLVLRKELDADDGELTRTRKVRRRFIGEKYATLVEALYSGKTECELEIQMKFEDGRTGTVRAVIRIADAETFAGAGARELGEPAALKKAS
ncbi:MAG TPA: AMP-binding protein [Alphaproteobacteria bacterium]|nr:AMP-binding protein [Alphaproteobacteria bacterium]